MESPAHSAAGLACGPGAGRAEQEHCLVKWLMVQKHCVLTVDGEALCPFMGALSPKRGL